MDQEFDVVIIGAGLSGIAAVKFHLDIHPQSRLVVLEQDSCLGGVFSSRRIYPHFWTQWTVGQGEFSDMPMPRPPEEDTFYDFFKSKYTTQYLERYVDEHCFAGQSLRQKIIFALKVNKIRKLDNMWIISGKDGAGKARVFHTSKLMVASGLTSTPNEPVLPGKEKFEGPVLHQESFGRSAVLTSGQIKNVTIIGGAKSAADMVYASVKAGKTVSWVFRTSGTGPAFFLSPKGKGPYKNAYEIGSTRLAGTVTPSILGPDTWWTRFLHGTSVGNRIVDSVWTGADKETRAGLVAEGRDVNKNILKLEPHTPIFWQNGTGGLLNRPDFLDTINQHVKIFEGEALELERGLVRLKNGQEVFSDDLLFGTGWTPSLGFFDKDLLVKLDLPYSLENDPIEEADKWRELEKYADQKVLKHFPMLANPPKHYHKPMNTTPYRLYNGIAPLHDDSIVFLNHVVVGNKFRAAEVQAIWATAYLDKKLSLPSVQEMEADIALVTAWSRRRYLSNGEWGNCMTFETIGYTDKLLEELGFSSHRKDWFSDFFVPCTARDLRGIREEYIVKYGRDVMKTDEGTGDVSSSPQCN